MACWAKITQQSTHLNLKSDFLEFLAISCGLVIIIKCWQWWSLALDVPSEMSLFLVTQTILNWYDHRCLLHDGVGFGVVIHSAWTQSMKNRNNIVNYILWHWLWLYIMCFILSILQLFCSVWVMFAWKAVPNSRHWSFARSRKSTKMSDLWGSSSFFRSITNFHDFPPNTVFNVNSLINKHEIVRNSLLSRISWNGLWLTKFPNVVNQWYFEVFIL